MVDARVSDSAASGPGSRGKLHWAALAVGILFGLYAAAFSLAVWSDVSNPGLALKLHPGLPSAAGQAADLRLFSVAQKALENHGKPAPGVLPPSVTSGVGLELPRDDQMAVRTLARDALRHTALSSAALRQLAYLEPDLKQRRTLLNLAQRVTRRDVLALLHSAELKLRANDMASGLADLDRSLVVSRTVDAAVFPLLLGAASANAEVAEAVGQRLVLDPPWSERMMRWAIANPASLPQLTRVLDALPANSTAREARIGQQVVDLLATQHRYPEAFAAYQVFAVGGRKLGNLAHSVFPPIDWKLTDGIDAGARIFKGSVIEIFASPGRQGEFAQLLADFAPGARVLTLQAADTTGDRGTLKFALICLEGPAERIVTEQEIPLRNGAGRLPFTIPASGCPYQRLTLGIAAETEAAGALIRSVSFGQTSAASR